MAIKRSITITFILLLFSLPLFAAEAVITGPDTVPAGQSFTLNSTESTADFKKWVPEEKIKNSGFICNDQIGFVLNKPGLYNVQLIVSDGTGIDYTIKTVKVVGDTTPTPDPPPEDPKDPPPTDLTKIRDLSSTLAKTVNDTITSKRLSTALKAIVASPTLDGTRIAARQAIETVLLTRSDNQRGFDWLNKWRKPIDLEIAKLAITTNTQYLATLKAIAEGLDTSSAAMKVMCKRTVDPLFHIPQLTVLVTKNCTYCKAWKMNERSKLQDDWKITIKHCTGSEVPSIAPFFILKYRGQVLNLRGYQKESDLRSALTKFQ